MYIPEKLPRVSFTVSREELFVLLHLLKAREMPGVDLTALQAGPDGELPEEIAYSLDAAIKSLVARGYVTPLQSGSDEPLTFAPRQQANQQKWTRVSVRPEVLALVGACAFSARSLRLRWRKAGGEDMLYIHEREGLVVVNTSPLPEVYTFTALEDWQAALSVIANVLEIENQHVSVPLQAGRLDAKTLTLVRDELHKDEINEVLYQFRAALPAGTGWTFTETITEANVIAGITMVHRDSAATKNGEQQRLSIVLTADTCFVLEPQSEDGKTLRVWQASAQEVRERIDVLWQ